MTEQETLLLDASALIALVVVEHEFHERVTRWSAARHGELALCPVVEGALVRYLLRTGESAATARTVLRAVHDVPDVVFWPDEVSYLDVGLAEVRGYRQVTDAYLVALARSRRARLVTLDEALARSWPAHTLLVPALS